MQVILLIVLVLLSRLLATVSGNLVALAQIAFVRLLQWLTLHECTPVSLHMKLQILPV